MAVLIIMFGILAILIGVALKGNKFQTNEDTYVITTPIKSSSQSSDKIKIDINSFITKYRSVIDESLFIQLHMAVRSLTSCFQVSSRFALETTLRFLKKVTASTIRAHHPTV